MSTLEQQRKNLSVKLTALSPVQKKKEKKSVKSPYQYNSLKGSIFDTRIYPKTLKDKVASLANFKPKERIVEKPVYLGEPGKKGDKGDRGNPGRDGKDAEIPVKGIHYFTTEEIEAVKKEISTELETKIPEPTKQLEIDQELVKKIVQIMHSLPETDKLEVSKGIRNAQSFIYGGTKYKIEELMHGGGSAGTTTTLVNNELVAGTGTTFTLANVPTLGSEQVYARGQRIFPTTGYTIVGAVITTVDTFVAGDVYATYTK